MIEVKATFPKRDNDGIPFRSSMFLAVESYLLTKVGGYSVSESSGAWLDKEADHVYHDHSYVYTVVMPFDTLQEQTSARVVMNDLKALLLNDFRQQCAWITYSEINIF